MEINKFFHWSANLIQNLKYRLGYREKRAIQAAGVGIFARIVTLFTAFFSTSLLVKHLQGEEGYGIFITISTLVGWIQLSNLGFGLGLQNNLIAAVAKNNQGRKKRLISTTQFSLFTLCGLSFLTWTLIYYFELISWTKILNAANSIFSEEINVSVYLAGCLIILQILLSYIGPFYIAYQRLHRYNYWVFASQIAGFVGLLIAVMTKQSLMGVIFFYQGVPVIVLLINAIWLTIRNLELMFPRLKYFSLIELRAIMAIGLSFSVIGLCGALQYGLDNIIISRTLSPAEVTPYNLITKLYLVYYTMSGTIFTPLWAAFGNAFQSNDLDWVKKRFKQVRGLMLLIYTCFYLGMILLGKLVIKFWIGPEIKIDLSLIILIGFYYLVRQWMDIYSMLINAINRVKIGAAIALPHGIVSALCMYYGAQWGGVRGMVIGMFSAFIGMGCWISPLIASTGINKRKKEIEASLKKEIVTSENS